MIPRETMDFFGAQDTARRKTFFLLIYYVIAVIATVLVVHVLLPIVTFPYWWFIAVMREQWGLIKTIPPLTLDMVLDTKRLPIVAGVALPVFIIGTLYKMRQFSRGGAVVAELMGGTLLTDKTIDPYTQQILNVVEEMSIASGIPCPKVYLLAREPGINAFAAGLTVSDAVMAVSWGCVHMLRRNELQGVVAHEFSHILNGDMRLNMRLAAILHGLMLTGNISRSIFSRLVRDQWPKDAALPQMLGICALGVSAPALIIASIGLIPARIIKGAISRQREYLADAHAVQFTRNPSGLADALKVIGGFTAGSRILNVYAEQASHFFIANGMGSSILNSRLLSTHPPVEERISRIDPHFDGRIPFVGAFENRKETDGPAFSSLYHAKVASGSAPSSFTVRPTAESAVPANFHLCYSDEVLSGMPAPLMEALYTPVLAPAVLYSLLLNTDGPVKTRQLDCIKEKAGADALDSVNIIFPMLENSGDEQRMAMVEIAASGIQKLKPEQYAVFREVQHNPSFPIRG